MMSRKSADPATPKQERGRKSISVISPAVVKARPSDADLPKFDPEKFKPGYTPPVVKKGDEEYNIIVSGVKDTGLCGKYWSDMDSLPSRRRRTTVAEAEKAKAEEEAKTKKQTTPNSTEKKRPGRKQSLKEKIEMTDKAGDATEADPENAEEAEDDPPTPMEATPGVVKKAGPGRKRKAA